ncbi:hypothetical protein SAG0014_06760 [Streptococcus agalactiae FSL S3-586]|nr:hypothetical protein SAG0014_06760 [Streptococcus agalactiae FSL S3-586]
MKDQGIAGAAKGGLSNMFSAADLMGQEAIGKVKDFAGGVADHVEQKEQAGHDAAYRGLKDYSLPTEPRPVSPFDPDGGDGSTVSFGGDTAISDDTGPSGGGIIDPTIMPSEPSDEAFSGISDPTSLTKETPMSSPIKDTPRHSENHSQAKRNFQQSMSDMHYMGQQMQQSAQRMQGQSHIRGAEIDESEE